MTDLHYRERYRLAALEVLKTGLGAELDERTADDGTLLTIHYDADLWERIQNCGYATLYGVLETLAQRHSTVTLHELSRLDDTCKRTVLAAYAALFGLEEAA